MTVTKFLGKLVAVPVVATSVAFDCMANGLCQLVEDVQDFIDWCYQQWDM